MALAGAAPSHHRLRWRVHRVAWRARAALGGDATARAEADAHRAAAAELAGRQASRASGALRERFVARPDVAELLD